MLTLIYHLIIPVPSWLCSVIWCYPHPIVSLPPYPSLLPRLATLSVISVCPLVFVYPSVCLSVYVCLPDCLPVCLPVCLSVCLLHPTMLSPSTSPHLFSPSTSPPHLHLQKDKQDKDKDKHDKHDKPEKSQQPSAPPPSTQTAHQSPAGGEPVANPPGAAAPLMSTQQSTPQHLPPLPSTGAVPPSGNPPGQVPVNGPQKHPGVAAMYPQHLVSCYPA